MDHKRVWFHGSKEVWKNSRKHAKQKSVAETGCYCLHLDEFLSETFNGSCYSLLFRHSCLAARAYVAYEPHLCMFCGYNKSDRRFEWAKRRNIQLICHRRELVLLDGVPRWVHWRGGISRESGLCYACIYSYLLFDQPNSHLNQYGAWLQTYRLKKDQTKANIKTKKRENSSQRGKNQS